jgi:hypothetical protein
MRHLGSFTLLAALTGLLAGCGGDDGKVTDTDTMAPAAPAGLSGYSAERWNIRLSWTPNNEPDLAGYNVYATDNPGDPASYELAGVAPAGVTTFVDEKPRGHDYSFRVSAVDESENVSTASVPVVVSHPAMPSGGARIPIEQLPDPE